MAIKKLKTSNQAQNKKPHCTPYETSMNKNIETTFTTMDKDLTIKSIICSDSIIKEQTSRKLFNTANQSDPIDNTSKTNESKPNE